MKFAHRMVRVSVTIPTVTVVDVAVIQDTTGQPSVQAVSG